jgi:hypothetical protein
MCQESHAPVDNIINCPPRFKHLDKGDYESHFRTKLSNMLKSVIKNDFILHLCVKTDAKCLFDSIRCHNHN